MIYCVYLPPENSPYGQNNEHVLNLLVGEMYSLEEVDTVLICGNFNARIGNCDDCMLTAGVPMRTVIDNHSNAQGTKLLEFMNDNKCCV